MSIVIARQAHPKVNRPAECVNLTINKQLTVKPENILGIMPRQAGQ